MLIPLITDDDLDLAPLTPDFLATTSELIGNAGHSSDGFDVAFEDLFASVAGFDKALTDGDPELFDLTSIPGQVDAHSLDDDVLTIGDSIAMGEQILSDMAELVPPDTTPPGGGGGGQPTPCGTHGQSSIAQSDDGGGCFAANTLPVVSIADSPCTFVFRVDGSSFPGRTTVMATSLISGDARLWAISHDSVPGASGGADVSRVSFTLTPYKTGHYLARFNVSTSRYPTGETWCLIVDVIA